MNDDILMISPEQAIEKRRTSSAAFILDIRSEDEFEQEHIIGAVNIPIEDIENQIYQLPFDRDIIIYSNEGNRSLQAAKFLAENGFEEVRSVTGGLIGLQLAIKNSPHEMRLDDLPEEQWPETIEKILDERVRPSLAMDGGGLRVIRIQKDKVHVFYEGACGSCPSSTAGTLRYIENALSVSLNYHIEVIPENDFSDHHQP